MNLIHIFSIIIVTLMGCSTNASDDPFYYKPASSTRLTVSSIPLGVKTLDLSGRREVDDSFIRELLRSDVSRSLVNVNLTGTSATETSLDSILRSDKIGTMRELPSFSERYGMPASKIHVMTDLSFDEEKYKRPVSGLTLQYRHPVTKDKMAEDSKGIRFLELEKARK